ncbi:endonuclease/exonuclease/phosphatase family protein [Actinoplanes sp. NEAU-A12]|uniref:Endonuclease/exonuclease/phosphatase family protein n=1 Tax=Actinoplanes sandaracinus TaxID=3045177 RepID=A0ABT6WNA1_9ACTN|nr:endonuclease/exonuclease/phosphatase family protein [Actinoplanes sandaracinus]MDI6101214.1 endonuclease/exonuclease/phosphatase family protein [Actinoplanes sandaracinus]
MTLRLMTWNIKNGGGDRLPAIIEVIRGERPDVLCLQELQHFQRYGQRRMRELASAVDMTAHLAPPGFAQPVAVLVREPLRILRRSRVRWRLHHAAAIAEIATTAGPLTAVSAHLNPFSPYRRMREARWLAARYASPRGLALIAGDMNGLDPAGDHVAALAAQPSLYRRRHLGPDGRPDTRAIAAFAEAGFTDLWHTAGAGDGRTVPTGFAGREFGTVRLDYLLASPALAARAQKLWVVRDEITEHASDHYPVRADVDL